MSDAPFGRRRKYPAPEFMSSLVLSAASGLLCFHTRRERALGAVTHQKLKKSTGQVWGSAVGEMVFGWLWAPPSGGRTFAGGGSFEKTLGAHALRGRGGPVG